MIHKQRFNSSFFLSLTLLFTCLCFSAVAQTKKDKLPRENVIDVPSVGKGLCVSNVFQSNMVLQRDKPIKIWGWAKPEEVVSVSFGDKTVKATANSDRKWMATLPMFPASDQPRTLTVENRETKLELVNVLVGDVWILGGQSNMEFPLSRIENGNLEIVSANYPDIRVLTVPAQNGPELKPGFPRLHEWSGWFSRHFRKGDWDACTPEIARELSAIGFVFARRIHTASRIPIGIIDTSRGGTTVETWTPDDELRTMDSTLVQNLLSEWDTKVKEFDPQKELETRIKRYRDKIARLTKNGQPIPKNETEPSDLKPGPGFDQNRPGNCYASMIAPLRGLSVKGAIFHQGYNNCFDGTRGAMMYRQIFPKMIKAWRDAFDDPEMPFGILSLCTEGQVQTMDNYCEMIANPGPYIREAQYLTYLDLVDKDDSQIGFVSTYDLRRRWYHPQLKIPAGERIARWALATQYGHQKSIRWQPPRIQKTEVLSDQIILRFDQPVGAVDDGSPIRGFAIAGENREFQPAEATHLVTGKDQRGRPKSDKRAIVLKSPLVEQPKHFRYAWARSPLGNLQADRVSDVPVATQRSDSWPLENVPAGVVERAENQKLDRGQKRKLSEALKALDRKRKVFEAQRLLQQTAVEK